MTVKDLIAALARCPPEAEIVVPDSVEEDRGVLGVMCAEGDAEEDTEPIVRLVADL